MTCAIYEPGGLWGPTDLDPFSRTFALSLRFCVNGHPTPCRVLVRLRWAQCQASPSPPRLTGDKEAPMVTGSFGAAPAEGPAHAARCWGSTWPPTSPRPHPPALPGLLRRGRRQAELSPHVPVIVWTRRHQRPGMGVPTQRFPDSGESPGGQEMATQGLAGQAAGPGCTVAGAGAGSSRVSDNRDRQRKVHLSTVHEKGLHLTNS